MVDVGLNLARNDCHPPTQLQYIANISSRWQHVQATDTAKDQNKQNENVHKHKQIELQ